jgi:hypothetical protein
MHRLPPASSDNPVDIVHDTLNNQIGTQFPPGSVGWHRLRDQAEQIVGELRVEWRFVRGRGVERRNVGTADEERWVLIDEEWP